MNTRVTISIVVILVLVVAGVVYWMMNKQAAEAKAKAKTEAEAAAALAAAAAAADTDAALAAAAAAAAAAADTSTTSSLIGDKFITINGNIIKPVTTGKKFEVVTSGVRYDETVITLEPVEGEVDTYFLFAKSLEKYIKYSNNGFGFMVAKPITKEYKIKFTKIGEKYAMSYVNPEEKQIFFGYNGTDRMIGAESVTAILSTGLVNVEDVSVTGYIIPGNFGGDANNYREFGSVEGDTPIETIQDCKDTLDEADLDEEYKQSLLSVALNKGADTPCRAYPQSDTYSYNNEATGWVTTCVDKSKDIKQGCLL